MHDLLFTNGTIIDGTGAPAHRADVAVENGRIEAIGPLPEATAKRVIDITGLVVAPGFIDIHTHADIALLARPRHEPKIMQGVTTEIFSNCGLGFAPVSAAARTTQRDYLLGLFGNDAGVSWDWETVAEFLDLYRGRIATNIAYLIPHGALRVTAMDMADRYATPEELREMVRLAHQGMEEGAWGLSTGLWYSPMSYAAPEENIGICQAVADKGGFFAIHMRDYGDDLIPALEESMLISEKSGAPLQISHLQIGGRHNWGRGGEIVDFVQQGIDRGLDISFDSYPYTAGSTLVQAMLPTWATVGGPARLLERLATPDDRQRIIEAMNDDPREWDTIVLCGAQSNINQPYEGLSFDKIAADRGITVGEFVAALLEEDQLMACFIAHLGDERDLHAFMASPAQMIGSDGLHLPGKTHPRLYGCFPRLLSRYVRERKVMSLEEGIRRMTSAPAARMGFQDRGRVAVGLAADLTIFNPDTIRDTATYDDPCRHPEGIPYVVVNGVLVKDEDEHTGALAGQVLTPG